MSNQSTKDDYSIQLWSQSQLRIKQQQNSPNIIKKQLKKKKKKKKKCRGNRKLQRFRRRCRNKGMNNETIETLLACNASNKQIQHQNQEKMITNMNPSANDMNIFKNEGEENNLTSRLASLLEKIAQKKWISSVSQSKRINYYRSPTDHWKKSSKLLPDYNKLSHYQLMDLLSKSVPMYRDQICQFLTNTKIAHFIQQRATLMCTTFQLKIEEHYWQYLAHLSDAMPIFNWLLQMANDVKLPNSNNGDCTKSKTTIKDRQKIIEKKLEQVQIDLDIHLQQYSSSLIIENTTYFEHSIKIIFMALAIVIRNDLQLFYMNFERKKILLHFDIKDAYYVKSFYDLNPTAEQIHSVQQIWQTKLKLCRRAIAHKKKHRLIDNQMSSEEMILQGHTSAINNKIDVHHIDNNYQQNHLSSMDSFPSAIHSIVQARLDNIEQHAQQILQFIDDVSP